MGCVCWAYDYIWMNMKVSTILLFTLATCIFNLKNLSEKERSNYKLIKNKFCIMNLLNLQNLYNYIMWNEQTKHNQIRLQYDEFLKSLFYKRNPLFLDLESTKINCNCILYVFNWLRLLSIITWNISMLKIQQVFQIKYILCVSKAQITFIRSCVNRYSWWNKSCDSRFTQLSIEA